MLFSAQNCTELVILLFIKKSFCCSNHFQGNMNDPQKSLEWYKTSLGTQLTNDQVFALLSKFYDDLDRAGVRHA